MNKLKHGREELMLKGLAADFLSRQSNRTSLITVTRVMLSEDLHRVDIMLSVLPEEKQKAALIFANRMTHEFKEYIKKNSRIRILPLIKFIPDIGEQNRQRIDELTEEAKRLEVE